MEHEKRGLWERDGGRKMMGGGGKGGGCMRNGDCGKGTEGGR